MHALCYLYMMKLSLKACLLHENTVNREDFHRTIEQEKREEIATKELERKAFFLAQRIYFTLSDFNSESVKAALDHQQRYNGKMGKKFDRELVEYFVDGFLRGEFQYGTLNYFANPANIVRF